MNIKEAYKKEALKCLSDIDSSLKKLSKGSKDKEVLFNIYKAAHTLKSSSFQMGFYSIGYLSHLMSSLLKEASSGKAKLTRDKVLFLEDFYGSLKKSLDYVLKDKDYEIDKSL